MTEDTRLNGDIEQLRLEVNALKKARDSAHNECKILREKIVKITMVLIEYKKYMQNFLESEGVI